MVRNLRPLVIPAGTGNGIGIAVGAGGNAGISHGSRCVNSPSRSPVASARSPIAALRVISRPRTRCHGCRPAPNPATLSGTGR